MAKYYVSYITWKPKKFLGIKFGEERSYCTCCLTFEKDFKLSLGQIDRIKEQMQEEKKCDLIITGITKLEK